MGRSRIEDTTARNLVFRTGFRLQGTPNTLTGNVTVVDGDPVVLAYDAGGSSRNVTFPTRATNNDDEVRFVLNLSTAGENLVIKDSDGTTRLTLPSGGCGIVFATGSNEAPGTKAWLAFQVGGEDMTITDDLSVTGDLTVTGPTALNGNVALGNATGDLVGAYGFSATQPASSSQAAIPTTTLTSIVLSYSTSTTGAFFLTNSTQIDNLVAFYNIMATRASQLTVLANQTRLDLISTGWQKGSA